MKFSKQILEAIKRGVNLALDDFENDTETQIQSKPDVIEKEKYNVIDSKFMNAMNNNDFESLGATTIKNIYKSKQSKRWYVHK